MTNPPGSRSAVTDTDDRNFTVVIPAAGPGHDTAELPPTAAPIQAAVLAEVPDRTARRRPASRWSRFGAALFWIVFGWWLFVAVRIGAAVVDTAYSAGAFRTVNWGTLRDVLRDATGRGMEELVTAAALSVVATVVLLASRGRRWLGACALVVAAGTIVTAVWQLAR